MHNNFYYRSEDILIEDIDSIYVQTNTDKENIEFLKEATPGILIGSRGTGKTMLLKMAEKQFDDDFENSREIGILVSFREGALLKSYNDKYYFRQWMLSKILFMLKRKLKRLNICIPSNLISEYFPADNEECISKKINELIKVFEESWKSKNELDVDKINKIIDLEGGNAVSDVDYFVEFIEDLCSELKIKKIFLFFDEACHNFIPLQQREFFTLFRDLRSSRICCKAAVYPGITNYGTLQMFHDVKSKRVERDIMSEDYIEKMRELVQRQIKDEKIYNKLKENGDLFNSLIYSCSGNPRLLLKSLDLCMRENGDLRKNEVVKVIKDFYRNDIWNEHTRLGDAYLGHKGLIDWGRNFVESYILPITWEKNSKIFKDENSNQTMTFAISKDSPAKVRSAVRILEYTGIICLIREGARLKYGLYDRYRINLGVVLASETSSSDIKNIDPVVRYKQILKNLSNQFDTECGKNSNAYKNIETVEFKVCDVINKEILTFILEKDISELDLSSFLVGRMRSIDVNTIGDILALDEIKLKTAKFIGDVRSRGIYGKAYNAAIEYISG